MKVRALYCLGIVAVSASSFAFPNSTQFYKYVDFTQSAPTTVNATAFYADERIGSDLESGEFSSGTMTTPGGTTFNSIHRFNNELYFKQTFASMAAMDAALPVGTYNFAFTGGTANGNTATYTRPAVAYPGSAPALSAPSFTALQSYDPTKNLTVNLNFTGPTTDATFQVEGTSLFVRNQGTYTINAGSLQTGKTYTYRMVSTNQKLDAEGFKYKGFGVASFTDTQFTTRGSFTVVPEPETWAALGLGILALVRRNKRK